MARDVILHRRYACARYGSTHVMTRPYGNASWRRRNGTLYDAREKVEARRVEYNRERPHSWLQNRTPEEFRRSLTERLDPVEPS
jgi:transposase InsO family protein